jgi:hypothetical protein
VDGDRLQTNVARLIVLVSILGALASWRASVWSERASAYDQQTAQEQVVAEQARAQSRAAVAQDLRLLGPAEEAYRDQVLLTRDARRAARAGDPQLAAELRTQARRRQLEGQTIARYVQSGVGFDTDPDGGLVYDAPRAVELGEMGREELESLRPAETKRLGDLAHDRTVQLVLASSTLVLALFFLTLSQLGGRLRRSFAGIGTGVAAVGVVIFALA